MIYTENWQSALSSTLENLAPKQVLYVADPLFEPSLSSLNDSVLFIKADEIVKDINTVEHIWSFFHHRCVSRNSLIVAIGGGVLSDLTGFAAATFKRGVGLLNIPTTLLAMVDASVGGKNGFNYFGVKNEIGCFYEPQEIIISSSFLQSLSADMLLSGSAEMIKTALIADAGFLSDMQSALSDKRYWQQHSLDLIHRCIDIKRYVVAQDRCDRAFRHILNFGHTAGHAIEAFSHQSPYPLSHGYAVMQGMVVALYLSVMKCGLNPSLLNVITRMQLEYYGKPTCECKNIDSIITLMHSDKKNTDVDSVNFVLLHRIAEPLIDISVSDMEIKEALEYLYSL